MPWEPPLSEGLHFGKLSMRAQDGSRIELIAVKASLHKFSVKIVDPANLFSSLRKSIIPVPTFDPAVDPVFSDNPTYSLDQISRIFAPNAMINGGYRESSPEIVASGLVIVDGNLVAPLDRKSMVKTGVVCIETDDVSILWRDEFDYDRCQSALQAGPLIIEPTGANGIRKGELRKPKANRSVLCLMGNSDIVLLRTTKANLYDIGRALEEGGDSLGLRCDVALNLSGGDESGLFVGAPFDRENAALPESGLFFGIRDRAIATAIALVPRETVGAKSDINIGEAADFIQGLGSFVFEALGKEDGTGNIEEVRRDVKKFFPNVFDVDFIVNFILGRFRKTADDDELKVFSDQYVTFIANYFSLQMSNYAGERLLVTGAQPGHNENEVVVDSRIQHPSGAYLEVTWKVKAQDDEEKEEKRYRIIDVVLEGVSMLVRQRAEFASFRTSRKARTVKDLINILAERNSQF